MRVPTGHVYRRSGDRGDVWYAKYRLPDGRQVKKRIGPAWTSRGRPAAGYRTKRTAELWLRDLLDEARRGTLPGMVRTGATFADAAAEYMRWIEHDRARKPSTVRDYRSIINAHLLPAFGTRRLEDITTEGVERWAAGLTVGGRMNNRTKLKVMTVLHGVMKRARRVWRLPRNPITDVEKPVQTHRTDIDVFSPEDFMAPVRAAASEQHAAIYLTAAFTGLRRGELVALRWRDVDFARRHIRITASYTERSLTTPKSGKVRSVPLAPVVAEMLARVGDREDFVGEDDLVFPGIAGGHLDASALYRRYKTALRRAGLRDLRFHDLRHKFGTQVIGNPRVSILQLKEWMGHADIDTTMKYLHSRHGLGMPISWLKHSPPEQLSSRVRLTPQSSSRRTVLFERRDVRLAPHLPRNDGSVVTADCGSGTACRRGGQCACGAQHQDVLEGQGGGAERAARLCRRAERGRGSRQEPDP